MTKTYRNLIIGIISLVVIATLSLWYAYRHNFYAVISQQFYRTSQLSAEQLEKAITQYHIQSVINLRGEHPEKQWYGEEVKVTQRLNIQHYDIPLDSKKLPPPLLLKQLVHLIETAPRPILVHCESGVDRSGLASLIALLLDERNVSELKAQISLRYFVISPNSIGKQVFALYEKWLAAKKLAINKNSFYRWLNTYDNLTGASS